jgi:hypothetical protein
MIKIKTSFLEVKRDLFSRDMCDDQQEIINSNKAKIIYIDMVRVLESDRNAVVARLKIHIGEFEERVKNYLATISEFKEENCKLADDGGYQTFNLQLLICQFTVFFLKFTHSCQMILHSFLKFTNMNLKSRNQSISITLQYTNMTNHL